MPMAAAWQRSGASWLRACHWPQSSQNDWLAAAPPARKLAHLHGALCPPEAWTGVPVGSESAVPAALDTCQLEQWEGAQVQQLQATTLGASPRAACLDQADPGNIAGC